MSQRICVFGDSIPWGAEDQERGGWTDRLKVFIKKTGKFNEVFNLANPGKESNYLVQRMEPECEARLNPEKRKGNVIIVQIGINDSQYVESEDRQRVEPVVTKQNIKKIIEISRKFVDNIVFIGLARVDEKRTCPIGWNDDKHQRLGDAEKYNNIIKKICSEEKIHFLDVFDLLSDEDLHDGLHPNEQGHEKLFQTVKDFLIENNLAQNDEASDF